MTKPHRDRAAEDLRATQAPSRVSRVAGGAFYFFPDQWDKQLHQRYEIQRASGPTGQSSPFRSPHGRLQPITLAIAATRNFACRGEIAATGSSRERGGQCYPGAGGPRRRRASAYRTGASGGNDTPTRKRRANGVPCPLARSHRHAMRLRRILSRRG